MLWITELIKLCLFFSPSALLMFSGSSVPGGSEEELEATLRKWNLLNNSQGELLKTEVQMF